MTPDETTHAALMGMSEEEWDLFLDLLITESGFQIKHYDGRMPVLALKVILQFNPNVLVSCYLAATRGRKPK